MTRPLLRVEKGPAAGETKDDKYLLYPEEEQERAQRGVRRRREGSQSQSQSQKPETRVAQPRPAWPSPASLSSSKQNPPLEGVGLAPLELWPSGDWSSPRALPTTHSHRSRARESSALAKTCMRTSITRGVRRVLQLSIPQTGLPLLNLIRSRSLLAKDRWTLPTP